MIMKEIKVLLFHVRERANCVIDVDMQDGRLTPRRFAQQVFQVIPQKGVVDGFQPALFFLGKRGAEVFRIDHIQQRALMLAVFRQRPLERARDVRHIALAGVMEKAGENEPPGEAPRRRFLRAADTVLAHRPERLHMAVSPTDQGQRVGNILDLDVFRLWVCRLKMEAGVCGYISAHCSVQNTQIFVRCVEQHIAGASRENHILSANGLKPEQRDHLRSAVPEGMEQSPGVVQIPNDVRAALRQLLQSGFLGQNAAAISFALMPSRRQITAQMALSVSFEWLFDHRN